VVIMKYECENCKLQFETEEPQNCPRCSSRKIRRAYEKKKFDGRSGSSGSATSGPTGSAHSAGSGHSGPSTGPKVAYSHQSFIGREGKEGWRDFHKSEVRQCADCGSTEFEFNWKHKERSCKKCGAIYPLPRRMG
jgi:DNA-directed RNA polymerase subunit RPC12/RpoP